MSKPITADSVPSNYADPRPHLKLLIEHINHLIHKEVKDNWPYDYKRKDGGRDRFLCRIAFNDVDLIGIDKEKRPALANAWRRYHVEVMDAYRQAGWTVDVWWKADHDRLDEYAITLPQVSIADVMKKLQSEIKQP